MPRHLKGHPSVPKQAPVSGPRPRDYHPAFRLSNITIERACSDPSPMAKHFTDFTHDFRDLHAIPKNLIHPGRRRQDGRKSVGRVKLPKDSER